MSGGRLLATIGLALAALGLLWMGLDRVGIHLGRLPGDVVVRRGRGTFHFPIVTSIIASALLTLVAWLVRRGRP
jgi:hypothetical protein